MVFAHRSGGLRHCQAIRKRKRGSENEKSEFELFPLKVFHFRRFLGIIEIVYDDAVNFMHLWLFGWSDGWLLAAASIQSEGAANMMSAGWTDGKIAAR